MGSEMCIRDSLQTDHIIVILIQINAASLSAYIVLRQLERAKSSILPNGKFREFSGIFSFAGGGEFAFSKREFPVALVEQQ